MFSHPGYTKDSRRYALFIDVKESAFLEIINKFQQKDFESIEDIQKNGLNKDQYNEQEFLYETGAGYVYITGSGKIIKYNDQYEILMFASMDVSEVCFGMIKDIIEKNNGQMTYSI